MTLATLPVLQPATPPASPSLADREGRSIRYLRLSLTRGCSMRCVYCRPAIDENPRDENRLMPRELERIVRHLVGNHGVRKVRLTGGDPTARPDLLEIIERVAAVPGVDDLAMTTNGLTLARHAAAYADAGLQRVNVSLDSLDAKRFARLTGVDGLSRVLNGIEQAAAHFARVKLNCVVIHGENETELPDLLSWATDRGLPLRMIELMPMGPLAQGWEDRFVSEARMQSVLAGIIDSYTPLDQGAASARSYRVRLRDGRVGEVGFITPMTCRFCAQCDRLRLGADGSVYPCLMDAPRGGVLDAVRPRFDARRFDDLLRAALGEKQAEHPDQGPAVMTHIGG